MKIDWERLRSYDTTGLHALDKRLDEDIQNEILTRKAQLEQRKQRKRKRAKRKAT